MDTKILFSLSETAQLLWEVCPKKIKLKNNKIKVKKKPQSLWSSRPDFESVSYELCHFRQVDHPL